jgi:hypothetical protein
MDDQDITKVQAPTLGALRAAGKAPANERDTRKAKDTARRRLDIINGKRRGRP